MFNSQIYLLELYIYIYIYIYTHTLRWISEVSHFVSFNNYLYFLSKNLIINSTSVTLLVYTNRVLVLSDILS